ncbi:MAG: phosphatase PAP2 family protein [Chitinivibrionales bacterium]|nr:phosphatase PAP2 family protein [Chitinivibrionales bacterium]
MPHLHHFDIALFWLINSNHNQVADVFFGAITNLGDGWVVAPVLVAFMVWKVPARFWRQTIICAIIGLAVGGWVNTGIKRAVDRPRPVLYFENLYDSAGNNPHVAVPEDKAIPQVHLIGPRLMRQSFPSGHTNTAFGAALLLTCLFGGWFWVSFLVAALVGYSRIYLGVHFPLDVFAGAVVGMAITGITVAVFMRMKWLPIRENGKKTPL